MSTLVVHASKYGAAQRYAEWIGEAVGAPVVGAHNVSPPELADQDLVVFCAAIYGPSLRDSVELRRAMELDTPTRWVLVTVGLSDPTLSDKRDQLVEAKFSAALRERLAVFHVRGAMDRSRLTFVDRSAMGILRRTLSGKQDLTVEDQAMLAVLELERVDLTDREAISEIVATCLG